MGMEDGISLINQKVKSLISILHKDGEKNPDTGKGSPHGHTQESPEHGDTVKDHLDELDSTIRVINDFLTKRGSPYRFGMAFDENDICISVIFADRNGEFREMKRKNITHEEFLPFIKHILEGEGVILDIAS